MVVSEKETTEEAARTDSSGGSPEEIVQLRGLTVRFQMRKGFLSRHKVEILAVDNVSFSIGRGRTLGLVGATDLEGGFQAWAASGLPVRRGAR